jgi:acyl-CoA dehydrogenase
MTAATERGVTGTSAHAANLRTWIASHSTELAPYRNRAPGGLDDAVHHEQSLVRMLFDAGWSRWGWPREAGGFGGTVRHRAVLYDELAAAGVEIPEVYVLLETLGPVLTRFAPALAARHLPSYLAGDEMWAQGFSEPDAGSDLASLRTKARAISEGFVLSGQKTWATLGQFARYAAVLARTGGPGHRGLSLLWVDLQAPGVMVSPIESANGRAEFAEMFFDDVLVHRDHVIGDVDGGWDVAMYLLQFERGMYAWLRQAVLHRRLRETVASAGSDAGPALHRLLGAAYVAAATLRSRSRQTVGRLAAAENPGPEISVDKILLSRGEQAVYDCARVARTREFLLGDGTGIAQLRAEWLYSRATSIFGGAVEVQRDIVASHVLRLPRAGRR